VLVGISGDGGELNGQRVDLLQACERFHSKDMSENGLWQRMRNNVQKGLQEAEIVVVDSRVNISALQETVIERYLIRLATNVTAQRNVLPDHHCKRKAMVRRYDHWLASIKAKRWQLRPLTKHTPGRRTYTSCAPRFGET